MNQNAAAKAATVAAMSIDNGMASTYCAAASAPAITANAAVQAAVICRLVLRKSGDDQNSFGTLSRAYCSVKDRPTSKETSAMAKRPASTASRLGRGDKRVEHQRAEQGETADFEHLHGFAAEPLEDTQKQGHDESADKPGERMNNTHQHEKRDERAQAEQNVHDDTRVNFRGVRHEAQSGTARAA